MTPDRVIPLLRDVVTLAVGGWMLVWAVTHGAPLGTLIVTAVVFLGPSGSLLLSWWLGTPAGQQSQPSVPSVPSQPSPSPSRGAAEP